MGTAGRNAEEPSTEIPDDGGEQHGENDADTVGNVLIDKHIDGQEVYDSHSDRYSSGKNAKCIPDTAPDDGLGRLERVRVNNGGHSIGRVVEPIDEFKRTGAEDA